MCDMFLDIQDEGICFLMDIFLLCDPLSGSWSKGSTFWKTSFSPFWSWLCSFHIYKRWFSSHIMHMGLLNVALPNHFSSPPVFPLFFGSCLGGKYASFDASILSWSHDSKSVSDGSLCLLLLKQCSLHLLWNLLDNLLIVCLRTSVPCRLYT